MADYITLTCPSCGATFEDTTSDGYYVCAYCGRKHILYRVGDSDVLLFPDDGLKSNVGLEDQTTMNILEINRVYIEALTARKCKLLEENPCPEDSTSIGYMIGGGLIAFYGLMITDIVFYICSVSSICIIFGVMAILVGIYGFYDSHKKKTLWDVEIAPKIMELDAEISSKRKEIEKIEGGELRPDDVSSFGERAVYPSYPATDINLLYSEIEELNHKKNRILTRFSKSTEKFGAITVFGIMIILLSLMLFYDRSKFAFLMCLAGCALMFWARYMRIAAQKEKDIVVGSKMKEIDEQIKLKMDEIQRSINEDGVSYRGSLFK